MNYDDINSSYIEYGDYGFVFEDSPGRVECETEERDWLESNQEKTGTFCPPYWDRKILKYYSLLFSKLKFQNLMKVLNFKSILYAPVEN